MVSSNFSFLTSYDPKLDERGACAERCYQNRDHQSTIMIARQISEYLAKSTAREFWGKLEQDDFESVVNELTSRGGVDDEIKYRFDFVRQAGNDAIHELHEFTQINAWQCLKLTHDLSIWFHKNIVGTIPVYPKFRLSANPDSDANDLSQTMKALEANAEDIEKLHDDLENGQIDELSFVHVLSRECIKRDFVEDEAEQKEQILNALEDELMTTKQSIVFIREKISREEKTRVELTRVFDEACQKKLLNGKDNSLVELFEQGNNLDAQQRDKIMPEELINKSAKAAEFLLERDRMVSLSEGCQRILSTKKSRCCKDSLVIVEIANAWPVACCVNCGNDYSIPRQEFLGGLPVRIDCPACHRGMGPVLILPAGLSNTEEKAYGYGCEKCDKEFLLTDIIPNKLDVAFNSARGGRAEN